MKSSVAAFTPLLLLFGIDALLRRHDYPRRVSGPLDEIAHAATAISLVVPLQSDAGTIRSIGVLGGAVLLDLDHLPQVFGARWLAATGERPYPHSLLFVLLLAGAGRMSEDRWRQGIQGAAIGVTTHLLRDMATGGVLFYWPLIRTSIRIPYWSYASLLILFAVARIVAPPKQTLPLGRVDNL
jgi:membrane-bound metal-dependent hydrolase YbcI (DUF457 family)